MTDPDADQWNSLLQGPAEIPLSQEHRRSLRSAVLDAYDTAARLPAPSPLAGVRLLLARVLAAAACVALGCTIGWFARGPGGAVSRVAPPPGPLVARPAAAMATSKAVPGDFWSYRRLARLSSSRSLAPDSPPLPRSPRSSMWDLPEKGH